MDNKFEIRKGHYCFEKYFETDKISPQTQSKLVNADIIAVPSLYADNEYYFAQETIDFIKFCRSIGSENNIDILADGDIKVRSLHSFDIWLPIIFIASNVFIPLIVNLISSYLWERMKGREHEEAKVNVTIIVKHGDEQKELHYDGDVKIFKETFKKIDINKM
jgi:hypothetical protein